MNAEAVKDRAKERDGHECVFCGVSAEQHTEEYGSGLHAHHIVPQRANGADEVSNLITVCRSCHDTIEKTQAEGLARVNAKRTRGIESEEHEKVIEQRDRLLERVHELERRNRDPDYYAKLLSRCRIDGEAVTEMVGNTVNVTADSDKARESYDDWGSAIKRVSLSVDDADMDTWIGDISDQLKRIERFGYDD